MKLSIGFRIKQKRGMVSFIKCWHKVRWYEDWDSSIGWSKVEIPDEYSGLSQRSVCGAVIWLEWAQERVRGEELETVCKYDSEEVLRKKNYSGDWRQHRKFYIKYVEYQENIKINFLECWRQWGNVEKGRELFMCVGLYIFGNRMWKFVIIHIW